MSLEESKSFATGCYHGVILVTRYMSERVNSLQETLVNPQIRGNCLRGLFYRNLALMIILEKLNDPAGFQSILASTRAMLEITVDMILIHHDKSAQSAAKIHWWGESAKLK
jgi:hypothetical protein